MVKALTKACGLLDNQMHLYFISKSELCKCDTCAYLYFAEILSYQNT